MMNKDTSLRIDKELGVIEKIVPNSINSYEETKQEVSFPITDTDDIEKDYEYQREQFYSLVDKGSKAIDGILELAKELSLILI